jgi:hypothetical protein
VAKPESGETGGCVLRPRENVEFQAELWAPNSSTGDTLMSKMAVLMTVGVIASLQSSASNAKDIPFTITWVGGTIHGIRCIKFEPFRSSGCLRIGPKLEDHRVFYRAQDNTFPAAGLWGCNLYRSDSCGGDPRANVGYCVGGLQEFSSVDLLYDDTKLTSNQPTRCTSQQ